MNTKWQFIDFDIPQNISIFLVIFQIEIIMHQPKLFSNVIQDMMINIYILIWLLWMRAHIFWSQYFS